MKVSLTTSMLLASLATTAWASTCLPIINAAIATSTITVDGIVAGRNLVGGNQAPLSCGTGGSSDVGWAGVLGQSMTGVGPNPEMKSGTMFFAAHQGGGGKMDKIYIAVHVENTPELTLNDKFTVYFQADATKTVWSPDDFALLFDGVGAAATPSDDGCTNIGGSFHFYKRNGANDTWVEQAPPAGIAFKVSYDYTNALPDAEWDLWELEIGIDVSSLNLAPGAQVGIGGKLYLYIEFRPGGGVMAFHYPAALVSSESGYDFDPNLGVPLPTTLEKVSVGNCTLDVVIKQNTISGSDSAGAPGYFTILQPGDFGPGGNATRQNHFAATVTLLDPSSPTSNLATPDAGNVRLHIKPYGNGGFSGDVDVGGGLIPVSFDHVGQEIPITRNWPQTKTQWDDAVNNQGLGTADHVCYFVNLSGFAVDLPNGNEAQQNLYFASASTIKSSFMLSVPREVPGRKLDAEGRVEYVLRGYWQNLAPKFLTGNTPFKYAITNAAALGMKDLGDGHYAVRLKPGERKEVMLEIVGGVLPNPNKQYRLPANAGGKLLQPSSGGPPLEIPVKPGAPVSLLVSGLVEVEKHPPVDANGYQNREFAQRPFLLRPGRYRPQDRIGAVVASCDKFKTAFVVGTDTTFVVPPRCRALQLAVNDIAGDYSDNKGEFTVNVMIGDPIRLPTRLAARGSVANPKLGIPAQLQAGAILPQLVVDISERVEGAKFARLLQSGYVAIAIYESHP